MACSQVRDVRGWGERARESTVDMPAVLRDVSEHWHVYATMPIIAALIGYITKCAAIEMMYRPLEFVGVRPFLGWQGVIPRN